MNLGKKKNKKQIDIVNEVNKSFDYRTYCLNRISFLAGFVMLYMIGYGYYAAQIENAYAGWMFYFFMAMALLVLVRFRANDIGMDNKWFIGCCILSMVPYVSGAVLLYLTFAPGKHKE